MLVRRSLGARAAAASVLAAVSAYVSSGCQVVEPVPMYDVSVSGVVFMDSVPRSGWTVTLVGPGPSSGSTSGSTSISPGGNWSIVAVGRAVTGSDGRYVIAAQATERQCGHLFLDVFDAQVVVPHTVLSAPEGNIRCSTLNENFDVYLASGWPGVVSYAPRAKRAGSRGAS